MDAGQKKPIMIAIIVVCFAAAGAITYFTRPPKSTGGGINADTLIWLKCNNPACKAEYQVTLGEYREMVKEQLYMDDSDRLPAATCQKCGKPSAFKAIKCPKCGTLFFEGQAGPHDYTDRCPKCKYSAREEELKKRQTGG